MKKIRVKTIKTKLGELIMGEFDNQLCLFDWKYRKMRNQIDSRILSGLNAEFVEENCSIFSALEGQFEEYMNKKRKEFDIPMITIGTEFQKKVWNTLKTIPYGKTESYLGLSKRLDNPKAVRAVASANGANAISILIPCHRIIGSNGSLGGYAGGLPTKQKLLDLESQMYFDWD